MKSPKNEPKTKDYKTYLKRLLQTTAIVAISGGHAFAQDADTPEVIQTPAAQAEDDNASKDVIVVTGSRIKKDVFTSSAPIEVLSIEEAQLEGISDVGTLLQTATVASGSPQITAATSSQFVQSGGVGATTVSLRGLGANRTLSLINGRRAGPSGTRGQVSSFDVNSIPLLALERVEILKDGASSIYGSDAVAGVVNYITDKSDSKSVDFFATQPEDSGGETYRLSGTWGETFDRGRIRLTGDYTRQKEMARGDRDYYDCAANYVFNADGSGNRADIIDPRTGDPQCVDLLWGHVWIYDYSGRFTGNTNVPTTFPFLAQYDYDGSLAAAGLSTYPNPGGNFGLNQTAPAGWFPIYYDQNDIDGSGRFALPDWAGINVGTEARGLVNGDHPFQDDQSLIPDIERITLMADGELELGKGMNAYGEVLFNRRTTKQNSYRQFWNYNFGENGLLFGSPAGDPLAAGWSGQGQWYSPTAITDHSDTKIEVDYLRFLAGLTGGYGDGFPGFLKDWTWDASFQFSRSDGDYTNDFIRNNSIRPYAFRTSSCAGTNSPDATQTDALGRTFTDPGIACVDVPWFDPQFLAGNIDQASRDFLFTTETGNTEYTVASWEAFTAGTLFKVPAGDVGVAIGGLIQTDEINDTPSNIVLSGNAWGTTTAGITAGKARTNAIYGEIDIPIVKDKFLMESFGVKASARYTDVKATPERANSQSVGSGTTYKVGADWQILPTFRTRASFGTSFRTPALFELFLANQTSSLAQGRIDPCIRWQNALSNGTISQTQADNCAADGIPGNFVGGAISATIVTGGGLGVLEPETSDNLTIGAIWSPEFADLKISLDYFKIEVFDQVARLGAGNILLGCYTSESFATEPLCDQIDRNPPGVNDPNRITTVRDSFININEQFNEGFDFNIRYGHDTRFGRVVVDGQATYQMEDFTRLLAQSQIVDTNGETGNPKLVANLNLSLKTTGPWTFVYDVDYLGKTSNVDRYFRNNTTQTLFGTPVLFKLSTEAVTYHTASVAREFGDSIRVVAGVRNIFGEEPPNVSNTSQFQRVGATDFSSNFDTIGRRFFVNVTKKFN